MPQIGRQGCRYACGQFCLTLVGGPDEKGQLPWHHAVPGPEVGLVGLLSRAWVPHGPPGT